MSPRLRLVAPLQGELQLPPLRPADDNRLRQIGDQLGRALDAGQLAVTDVAPPSRLIDVCQGEPKPLVVWSPTRLQLLGRRVRRLLRRIF